MRRIVAVIKKMIAKPMNGTSNEYLSARNPITDDEGLAKRMSNDR